MIWRKLNVSRQALSAFVGTDSFLVVNRKTLFRLIELEMNIKRLEVHVGGKYC